jgi:hypothetical protein
MSEFSALLERLEAAGPAQRAVIAAELYMLGCECGSLAHDMDDMPQSVLDSYSEVVAILQDHFTHEAITWDAG